MIMGANLKILVNFLAIIVLSGCVSSGPVQREIDSVKPLSQAEQDEVFLSAQLYIFADNMKEAERVLSRGIAGVDADRAIDFNLMLARVESELGKMEEAYKRYIDLVNLYPRSETVLKETAQFLYGIRIKEEAYSLYSRLIKINPKESNYWIYRGLLALELANAKEAWESFSHLVYKSKDAKHLGHLYMGKLMQMTGFQKKANSHFRKCLKIKAETKDCLHELAKNRYEAGQKKRAVADLSTYLEKYKIRGNQELVEQLVDWHIEGGDLKAAISDVESLERLSPSDINLKRRLASMMVRDEDYVAALERMNVVIHHDQANERDSLRYVKLLDLIGRNQEASDYLQKTALSKKSGEKIFFEQYERSRKEQSPSVAKSDFAKLCKKSKKANECSYVHAYILWDAGEARGAKKTLEKLLGRAGKKEALSKPKYFLSQLYYDEGQNEKALKLVDDVLESDENYAPALNFKSYYLVQKGLDLEEAENLALRAVSQQPQNGHYLDTYGLILFKKGRVKEALSVLKEAVRLTPDEPEILEHLADVYVEMRNFQTAEKFYNLASGLYKGENQDRIGGKLVQVRSKAKKRSISSIADSDDAATD